MPGLQEGQIQVRDLVMGRGTAFRVLEFNPYVRTVRAESSEPRAWGHGAWSGPEWTDDVVVPLRVRVEAEGRHDWFMTHAELAAAFAAVEDDPTEVELRWCWGGREYAMFGRPRMVEPDVKAISTGRSWSRLAFVALDPRIWSGVETQTGPIGLPAWSGGLTVPITAPVAVNAVATGGVATLRNEGTAVVGIRFRAAGPAIEPHITLPDRTGTPRTISLGLTLAAGQWVDVDTEAGTVYLQGDQNRRGDVSVPDGWPELAPGAHELRWSAAEYNPTATLTAWHRSAW